MRQFVIVIFMLSIFLPSFGQACGRGRDGCGIAIVCEKNGDFSEKVFLADTFGLITDFPMTATGKTYVGGAPLRSSDHSEDFYKEYFLNALKQRATGAAKSIRDKLEVIKFIPENTVPNIGAEKFDMTPFIKKEPLIGKYCSPKQLARYDRANNKVFYNKDLFNKLSNSEKALFKIHEAYVSAGSPGDDKALHDTMQRIVETGWISPEKSKAPTSRNQRVIQQKQNYRQGSPAINK